MGKKVGKEGLFYTVLSSLGKSVVLLAGDGRAQNVQSEGAWSAEWGPSAYSVPELIGRETKLLTQQYCVTV